MQNKIPFGTCVRVKATILRMRKDNFRYWKKYEDTNFEAIFLGYRTLQDGKSVWEVSHGDYFGEPESEWYFEVEKYHRGALVCRKGFNPIKVFLSDIEVI